jgi:hypothetical protein
VPANFESQFVVTDKAVETGALPPESAIAPQTNSAAAELDQNCFAIFGTQTVLAESPELVCGAMADSGRGAAVITAFAVTPKAVSLGKHTVLKQDHYTRGTKKPAQGRFLIELYR